MKDILYAPWRTEYTNKKRVGECAFCYISKHPDEDESLQVLHRDEKCFVVMNKYPYTPGHFMIIPHFHTGTLDALPQETWLHMCLLAQKGVRLLQEGYGAHGVNIGMNLGEAGGAGISEHIHLHLVPRWKKDTNFITTIGETRVYSTDFDEIYKKLLLLAKKYMK